MRHETRDGSVHPDLRATRPGHHLTTPAGEPAQPKTPWNTLAGRPAKPPRHTTQTTTVSAEDQFLGTNRWIRAKSGNASAVWCGDGVGEDGEGGGTGDRVVVESLDAEEAPVGGEADLAECGQVGQPLPDLKIVAVVDGGFGAQRSSLFVILLDRRGFVVHVQAGYDTRGDHPSTEPS